MSKPRTKKSILGVITTTARSVINNALAASINISNESVSKNKKLTEPIILNELQSKILKSLYLDEFKTYEEIAVENFLTPEQVKSSLRKLESKKYIIRDRQELDLYRITNQGKKVTEKLK
ncbi:MAG: hypothetical protein AB4372_30555 [Xenococcus sp. (in: cyanobacteria)]